METLLPGLPLVEFLIHLFIKQCLKKRSYMDSSMNIIERINCRYGFHGTSHKFVAQKAAAQLEKIGKIQNNYLSFRKWLINCSY